MQISGTIKTIIYRSEQNGFTVAELIDPSGEEITVVGTLPLICVGERVEVTGEWTEHRSYGMQFKAASCTSLAPATLSSLESYLSSGLIKGVGEVTARAIVQCFGENTLDVLENAPERLTEVVGIGPMRASTIAASYHAQREMRDTMMALQELGVSPNQAVKLYKLYGPLCLPRIRSNPYSLVEDVEGIGFKTADAIAQKAGVETDSPQRLAAGVKYVLSWARREGHTFLPREKLISVTADTLQAEVFPVENAVDELILQNQLCYKIVEDVDGVFLPSLYAQESDCAMRLLRLAAPQEADPFLNLRGEIRALENEMDVQLAPLQREAVKHAIHSGALVITGGPGTGKTTLLRFLIRILSKMGLDFELCAPTGRAAKRMSEATGQDARTIHRLLEYGFEEEGFARNEQNPLFADVIIVDEMSMVDVPLMHALLKALPQGARLIMVGDADQLPPVGAGNVLRDIIASGTVPVVRLTEVFRQAEESLIVTNAHRINHGEMPELHRENADFGFEEIASAEDVIRRLIGYCSGKLKNHCTDEPFRDVQVLAPMKKGSLGVFNLNTRLQAALNPPERHKKERQYGDITFREGDKVMQIKNDYKLEWVRQIPGRATETGLGVYNGDLGTIMRIDLADQAMEVLFDDERAVVYDFTQLEELSLAYCLSVHKSQGSEFPMVLMPIISGPPMLMNRNLLYTAVTRARSEVRILGREGAVQQMVSNMQTRRRYSALGHFMAETKTAGSNIQEEQYGFDAQQDPWSDLP